MLLNLKLSVCAIYLSVLLANVGVCWRIVGGRPGQEGEIPYQASLRRSYNDDHFCGGSVITSLHVLTAAHCMFYQWGGLLPPIVVSVVVGQLDLSVTKTSVYRNASEIIVHEHFDRTLMSNDIAIIKLDTELPLNVNKLVIPIPMRKVSIISGKCIVSGWGFKEHESGIISDILLAAEVNIIDFPVCYKMYAKEEILLAKGMLCAGHQEGKTDACQGDSGGPLACDGVLTGVVSTGSGCGEAAFPGIYSDVATFLPWIQNQIGTYVTQDTSSTDWRYLSDSTISTLSTINMSIDRNIPSSGSTTIDSTSVTDSINISVTMISPSIKFSTQASTELTDTTDTTILDTTTTELNEPGGDANLISSSLLQLVFVLIIRQQM